MSFDTCLIPWILPPSLHLYYFCIRHWYDRIPCPNHGSQPWYESLTPWKSLSHTMLSQAHHVVPQESCQFASRQQVDVEQKSPELVSWGDDINMNTTTDPSSSSAQGYINSAPTVSVKSSGVIHGQTAVDSQKDKFSLQNHKPNIVHLASGASSALDPNCNEPSLLCLCCNGYSPQDNNSTYNLNYINNNTVTFQQQAEITQSSSDESYQEISHQDQQSSELAQFPHSNPSGEEVDQTEDEEDAHSRKEVLREEYADEDDTLIPSCWDCPPSLLEFSLSSFTSSSSTSISGCSDLESDCPDAISLSCQDFPPESQSACSLDDQLDDSILESCPPPQSTMHGRSHSGLWTPSSDSAEGERPQVEDDGLLDLQRLSESVEELGRAIHRQAAQLAQWDLEGYLELRGELDQLEVLGQENIPRGPEQVSAVFCGADLWDFRRPLDRETLSRPLDCSEAGAESSESSVYDDCVFPDACVSSPLLPSQQSAMLPIRDMDPPSFTYMNMNASTPSPPTTSSTNSSSPTFSNSSPSSSSSPPQEVKAPTSSLSIPPPQPIPYFTFHSSSTSGPPPIPPPRRKRQARLEALRRAGEQNGETPSSQRPPLPPPPPLPPAPPPPPQHTPFRRPAPMPTPPPPSFHALDDEIRKLLILAGVTQDELLKLGPEFGVGW
ncbi:hypothetical protein GJAV_G00102220 [Gymnothorax javanicus]|nr:hypothetical protein GJAV_G00102220 [Gymnothorax javanicus]